MVQESPLNFFHSKAKKQTPAKVEPQASLPPPKMTSSTHSPSSNPLIESMLDRMNRMRQELDDKIEELARENGLSQDVMREYLSNPDNFTKEQWEFLQARNNELTKSILASIEPAIGQAVKVDVKAIADSVKSPPPKTSKKGKFVGSRRKWIPTR